MGAMARVGGGALVGLGAAWALVLVPAATSGDTYEITDPLLVMGIGGLALGAMAGLVVHALRPSGTGGSGWGTWLLLVVGGFLVGAGLGAFAQLTGMTEPGVGLPPVALTGGAIGGLVGAALAGLSWMASRQPG